MLGVVALQSTPREVQVAVALEAGLVIGLLQTIITAFQVRIILDSRILELRSRWSYRKNAFFLFAFLFFLSMEALLISPITEFAQRRLFGIFLWFTTLAVMVMIAVGLAIFWQVRYSVRHRNSR